MWNQDNAVMCAAITTRSGWGKMITLAVMNHATQMGQFVVTTAIIVVKVLTVEPHVGENAWLMVNYANLVLPVQGVVIGTRLMRSRIAMFVDNPIV